MRVRRVLQRFNLLLYAGSSTPTQYECGGPQFYCPAATGAPLSLVGRTDVYSVPGTGVSATTQTGTAPCPFQRLCVNGSLTLAVVPTGACASGSMTGGCFALSASYGGPVAPSFPPGCAAYLQHLNASYAFGPSFDVVNQAIPSYNGISEKSVDRPRASLLPPTCARMSRLVSRQCYGQYQTTRTMTQGARRRRRSFRLRSRLLPTPPAFQLGQPQSLLPCARLA